MKPNRIAPHLGRSFTVLLAAWLGLLGHPPKSAQAQPAVPSIAVLEFQAVDAGRAEAAAVADQLRNHLVNRRAFTVAERTQTEAVLDELAFQQVGVTDPQQAARVGRLLNVQFIVTGRLIALPGAYQVQAQMVRVETARIERSESMLYRGNIVGVLAESVPLLADRLVQSGPVGAPGPAAAAPVMVQPGKPNWPLWVGGLSLAGALVAADSSADKDDEARREADLARQENNPDRFAEAQALNRDAARLKNAAYVLGAVGIGLIAYHLLSDAPDPGVTGARPLHEAPAWNVGMVRGVLAARYTAHW